VGKREKIDPEKSQEKVKLDRICGSIPWLKAREIEHYTAKALALRLPAELGLEAGMEMNLRSENGEYFSFEPVDAPKRKFNIDKIWGSANGLELIKPEDRVFEERKLLSDDPEWPHSPDSPDSAK